MSEPSRQILHLPVLHPCAPLSFGSRDVIYSTRCSALSASSTTSGFADFFPPRRQQAFNRRRVFRSALWPRRPAIVFVIYVANKDSLSLRRVRFIRAPLLLRSKNDRLRDPCAPLLYHSRRVSDSILRSFPPLNPRSTHHKPLCEFRPPASSPLASPLCFTSSSWSLPSASLQPYASSSEIKISGSSRTSRWRPLRSRTVFTPCDLTPPPPAPSLIASRFPFLST